MNPVGPRWAKCKYSHDLRGLITHCSNNGKERHKWSWLGSAWWAALMMSWWNNLTIRCVGFYFVCFVSLQILFFKTTFNQIVKMSGWWMNQSPISTVHHWMSFTSARWPIRIWMCLQLSQTFVHCHLRPCCFTCVSFCLWIFPIIATWTRFVISPAATSRFLGQIWTDSWPDRNSNVPRTCFSFIFIAGCFSSAGITTANVWLELQRCEQLYVTQECWPANVNPCPCACVCLI